MSPYGAKWLDNKKKKKGNKRKKRFKLIRKVLEHLRAYSNNRDWSDWE